MEKKYGDMKSHTGSRFLHWRHRVSYETLVSPTCWSHTVSSSVYFPRRSQPILIYKPLSRSASSSVPFFHFHPPL
ncbi:hypothetical protein GLYMA_04G041600v4 [Glycine max]|uniref:Uncharacterized protein n=1 Tax=Glycine max TaxID=3847 RepID=K7KI06_SOYBN|nr:hypothetical protein GYH30_008887 [Glycine max]KRH61342.1 hypothetical protein GLYMA_04G041600v4 [Glycine max]